MTHWNTGALLPFCLCKPRKIKPLISLLCYPYHLSHHPEGTPGSCWGWTLAIALSPFWLCFVYTRSSLSPPSPYFYLPNSVNIFVCSRLWRILRDLISAWICLSPFHSPFSPPGHLCLLPPSSLLFVTPWTSPRGQDCGEHTGNWLLASLLSLLLIPPLVHLVTSISLLPLLFSM